MRVRICFSFFHLTGTNHRAEREDSHLLPICKYSTIFSGITSTFYVPAASSRLKMRIFHHRNAHGYPSFLTFPPAGAFAREPGKVAKSPRRSFLVNAHTQANLLTGTMSQGYLQIQQVDWVRGESIAPSKEPFPPLRTSISPCLAQEGFNSATFRADFNRAVRKEWFSSRDIGKKVALFRPRNQNSELRNQQRTTIQDSED